MNILLTSVGRRAYMVKYFKEAVGSTGSVHVCNSDDLTVAFRYADHSVISPLIYDENYIPFLVDYCKENHIDLLISLFDIDLLILAKHKEEFLRVGTRVVVGDPALIEICNDKWKTYQFLRDNGFNVPRTFVTFEAAKEALNKGDVTYPMIVKPRFGMGSIALSKADEEMGLNYYHHKNTEVIRKSYLRFESAAVPEEEQIVYQECLNGQEYGADVIHDLDGKLRNIIVKKKIAMRAGETDISEIVDEPAIRAELEKLSALSGHIGNMDVDVFLVDGKPYILEMNARFGGGYPFSHMGGCNLPQALVDWAEGREVPDSMLQAKVGMRGFKELVITSV
ncbi:MAG: ATP-grasp domain-containing protein [Clostridiales bacterium]|nr:ATP-grasp domain-containing protein [Clostridiales bacterium]